MVISSAGGVTRTATCACDYDRLLGGHAGWHGQPVNQRDLALDLAALAQASNNRCNQQLLWVGMNVRIQLEAGGDDAGSDVGAILDVHAAVDAETALPLRLRSDPDGRCPSGVKG